MRYAFVNARLATQSKANDKTCILVNDGKIAAISENAPPAGMDYQEIDVQGNYLSPGFIDIHLHGGNGYDFMDASADAFIGAAEFHAKFGTTSMVPTLCTAKAADYKRIFKAFKKAQDNMHTCYCAELLGLHIEGPYISKEFKGAQSESCIKRPLHREYESLFNAAEGNLIIWGGAPEIPGVPAFGQYICSRGIVASIAHSSANYKEAAQALTSGFTHITHFYNAMSGVRKTGALKNGGVIEAGYLDNNATIELIADGIHVPACLLKLAYKIKGAGKICLISDAIRAAGLSEGTSTYLGNKKDSIRIVSSNGAAWLEDRSALAGSVVTTNKLLANMVNLAEVPLNEAVKMLTSTPATVIGFKSIKGLLKPGRQADIVIFDKKFKIKMTMIRGRIVYDDC